MEAVCIALSQRSSRISEEQLWVSLTPPNMTNIAHMGDSDVNFVAFNSKILLRKYDSIVFVSWYQLGS